MPIKLETDTKIIGKNIYIDNEKKNLRMDIGGMVKPQIIIREGQNFTIVKETKNEDDEKSNIEAKRSDDQKEESS
jgi:hypothetical protein